MRSEIIHIETIDYAPAHQVNVLKEFRDRINSILEKNKINSFVKWLSEISGGRIYLTAIVMEKRND